MKKYIALLITLMLTLSAFSQEVSPDTQADTPTTSKEIQTGETSPTTSTDTQTADTQEESNKAVAKLYTATSTHYYVKTDISEDFANKIATFMEALFSLANKTFRFDTESLTETLNVRIFTSQDDYDTYIKRLTGTTRDSFIYLHYSTPSKRELVAYQKEDTEEFYRQLMHQGTIQFLRAFISNPPLWLQEGMAVFFEASEYSPQDGTINYKENLMWLESLKNIVEGNSTYSLIPLSELLDMEMDEASQKLETYYPEAWGFVSFLTYEWNKDYNRALWDTFKVLSPDATYQENQTILKKRVFAWLKSEQMETDFKSYIKNKKSFRNLLEDGISLYKEGKLKEAQETFVKASKLNPDHFAPYYYLGLAAYAQSDYSLAEYYYSTALEKGADKAITSYALGVNAYASQDYDKAKEYLNTAKELSPEDYGTKADTILTKITEKEQTGM
ncbi:tetratricopeptide repeat protein [Spirochaetia bacterium 38H-sp]|uniref:Tetratricopeptide repeat protein n=1 Tax=Rarispira pelagica TaxID=3141764 RepID=A0ABU9UCB4_9SPIR